MSVRSDEQRSQRHGDVLHGDIQLGDVRRTGVIIVGAGFSGIGLGAMLKRQRRDDFVVLERGDSVGGTWRDNTYPGLSCDVPSQVYSFSWAQNPNWSRVFAPGAEIQDYLVRVANDEGVTAHIRYGTEVQRMMWDEDQRLWVCTTSMGTYSAPVLVLACGRLSEPAYPAVPGLATFVDGDPERALMHTARWRHDVDFSGKRVAVVGSGASAIQVVPELAKVAKELTVMQRSAPYVVARNDRPYDESERRMFQRLPETMAEAREAWFWRQETVFAQRALLASEVDAARERALGHLRSAVADAQTRRRLTPRYEIGCKRVLLSDDYYATFSRPNVSLVDSALAAVEPGRLISVSGETVEADVAVLATGFESAKQPYAKRVFGERGMRLAEEWRDGMYAYNSVSVPGFPNMFILNGPNASLGHNSAIVMIETQIDYVCQGLAHMAATGINTLSVERDAAEEYRQMIDDMSANTVWLGVGCESWYRDSKSGRLTLLWPGPTMMFREHTGRFVPDSYSANWPLSAAHDVAPHGAAAGATF